MLLNARKFYKDGEYILLAIVDITTQKHIEKLVQQTRDKAQLDRPLLHSLFMEAPVAIAIFRGPKYIIEFANPAVCKFWGRKLKDVINKPLFDALPDAAGQGYEEQLAGVLKSGKSYRADEVSVTLLRRGKKETVFFNFVYQPIHEVDGTISGIVVIANEITEQIVAKQEREQQARTFDTTLATIKDFVYTFDTSGRFTYSNKPLLDLLGMTLTQIKGKNFHELPYPEVLATLLQKQLMRVVTTGKPVTDETEYISPSGHVGHYEYIFMPVFGITVRLPSWLVRPETLLIAMNMRSERMNF